MPIIYDGGTAIDFFFFLRFLFVAGCSVSSTVSDFRFFVSTTMPVHSSSSLVRMNRLTKNPFVRSWPGEQRTSDSASAVK